MDQNYENVRCLIDELIAFRKRVPQDISDILARNNKEILKCLGDVHIKLQTGEININIPDNFFEYLTNDLYQLDEKPCGKIYEQIQFLNILIKKRKSPISKIIDDI